MATEDFSAHLRTVNESGFPLQIAVANLITTNRPNGWSVRYTEHAWRDPDSDASGFIDIVLQSRAENQYLVVECKRVRDVEWIFLSEDGQARDRRQGKCWISRIVDGSFKFFGWEECPLDPSSAQTSFCVVRGQAASGPRPMLERIASEVVSAAEALAKQEREFRPPNRSDLFRAYFGIIVTTAPLLVGRFNPAVISLTDGMLDEADFQRVPYVRFRKQLLDAVEPIEASYESPGMVAKSRESMVFVVTAEHLEEFLAEFEIDNVGANRFR